MKKDLTRGSVAQSVTRLSNQVEGPSSNPRRAGLFFLSPSSYRRWTLSQEVQLCVYALYRALQSIIYKNFTNFNMPIFSGCNVRILKVRNICYFNNYMSGLFDVGQG